MEIDRLKALMDGIKAKMFTFAAAIGGSFAYILKDETPTVWKVVLYLVLFFSAVGFFKNLKELGDIIAALKGLKDD